MKNRHSNHCLIGHAFSRSYNNTWYANITNDYRFAYIYRRPRGRRPLHLEMDHSYGLSPGLGWASCSARDFPWTRVMNEKKKKNTDAWPVTFACTIQGRPANASTLQSQSRQLQSGHITSCMTVCILLAILYLEQALITNDPLSVTPFPSKGQSSTLHGRRINFTEVVMIGICEIWSRVEWEPTMICFAAHNIKYVPPATYILSHVDNVVHVGSLSQYSV